MLDNHSDPVFLARRYHPHALAAELRVADEFGQHTYADALREAIALRAVKAESHWSEDDATIPRKVAVILGKSTPKAVLDALVLGATRRCDRRMLAYCDKAIRIRKEEDVGGSEQAGETNQ